MKIEKGMYVRTKNGLDKIKFISEVMCGLDETLSLSLEKETEDVLKKDILKASYNIIDLIELGDYVNGHRVYRMHRHATNGYLILELELGYDDGFGGEYDDSILEEEIKSIVTHEQFDNIKYEVK